MKTTRLLAAIAIGCATLTTVACKDNTSMDAPRTSATTPSPTAPGATPPSAAPTTPGGSSMGADTARPAAPADTK